ncbi:hypothetical protein [Sphingosinicella sp. BN140058]|uniref:hypothetical protein n=1 Tax=Sphingosinicella sp. BN140058 TaxID=1892855 RepID=UPI0010125C6D|nr:hypothetical protein [Sphingosinicella sp. BN140058]QAY77476.1 hypothetical protein ETR14_13910 [Sphingosinicella sp. BN140058]
MRARPAISRSSRHLSYGAIGLLGLVSMAALFALRQELDVERWTSSLQRQQRAFERGEPSPAAPDPAGTAAPRARLLRAIFLLRTAQTTPDAGAAQRLRQEAEGELAAARTARATWGDAAVVTAFAESLRQPESMSAIASALAESYRGAPYLKDASRWRIEMGLWCWDLLPPVARDRLINEAVWYVRLRPQDRTHVFGLMRLSPAYRPFLLRWYAVRSGDSDWRRGPVPMPAQPGTSSG